MLQLVDDLSARPVCYSFMPSVLWFLAAHATRCCICVQAPKAEAAKILQRRFPVPRLVDCDQNGSQVCSHLFAPTTLNVLCSEPLSTSSYKMTCHTASSLPLQMFQVSIAFRQAPLPFLSNTLQRASLAAAASCRVTAGSVLSVQSGRYMYVCVGHPQPEAIGHSHSQNLGPAVHAQSAALSTGK